MKLRVRKSLLSRTARFGDLYTYQSRGSERERVILFVALRNEATIPPSDSWLGVDLMDPKPVRRGSGWASFDTYRWRYLGNIADDL